MKLTVAVVGLLGSASLSMVAAAPPAAKTPASGLEKSPTAAAHSSSPELPVRMWVLPADFRSAPPPAGEDSDAAPADARAALETAIEGIKFAAGEMALYDAALRVLMVRAKPETMVLVEGFVGELKWGWTYQDAPGVRVEASLVEFSAAKASALQPPVQGTTAYETLRQAAGDSWEVLNRVMITTKSGQRAISSSKAGAGTPAMTSVAPPAVVATTPTVPGKEEPSVSASSSTTAAPDAWQAHLQPGETGAIFEIEPVVGPDGMLIDLNFIYHFRAPGPHGGEDWKTTTSIMLKDGIPAVIALASAPPDPAADGSRPARLRALILRGDCHPAPRPQTLTPPPLPTFLPNVPSSTVP